MKEKKDLYRSSLNRIRLEEEVYSLYRSLNLPLSVVMEKTGLSRSSIFKYLRTFEASNPLTTEQMKKRKDVTPSDYKKLQDEIVRLRSELKRERCSITILVDYFESYLRYRLIRLVILVFNCQMYRLVNSY